MKRTCGILLPLAFQCLAATPPMTPDEALKSFQLADPALRVELVAAEPLIESPCAIAFDEKGRLFVAENRGYPNTVEPPQGRIALLEDTGGDGRMDQRTTFADALTFPNGVLPWRGGVIVTCAPDVLFLKDTDGDGRADERRVLLTGFDTKGSTQLRVNCPTLGPDGWIYFAAGLSGGNITSPAHPDRAPVKMTGDLRWHPDTGAIENVDGRSQYGMSFDDFGRRFICMNRVPVQHVVLQSKWLRRNPHLAFSDTVQDCNERTVKTGLKGGGDGVRLFPISSNITTADSHAGSFSAACAITIWRGGALPDAYRGCALTCDPTGNLIHADKLTPRGATFAATPMFEGREFLASRDDWFRPVFLTSGPDGALYVADMYRKVIEHPDYLPEEIRKRTDFESGKAMGRIWRVIAKVAPASGVRQPSKNSHRSDDALRRAIALGDNSDPGAADELAQIAANHIEDRWMRAAILSGVAGKEVEFLDGLFKKLAHPIGPSAMELIEGVGRGFQDVPSLKAALKGQTVDMRGRDEIASACLLLGIAQRSGKRLSTDTLDGWAASVLHDAAENSRDENLSRDARLLSIRLLGRMTWPKAGDALRHHALNQRDDQLRTTAILELAGFDESEVTATLLAAGAWGKYTPAMRETVISALLANPAHIGGILDALESSRLPASAIPAARRSAFLKHKDPAIRARAERVFAASTPGDRQAAFEKAKAALALKADAAHGRELFKAQCATCHRLDREGHAVGPDLLDMRNQPKESILFHIVVPDAEVAPAFAAYLAEAKDGRSVLGVLASETPTSITLRGPLGQETPLLRSEIAKLEALPNSLMPAGFEAAMSQQDLADLLGYLKGEGP